MSVGALYPTQPSGWGHLRLVAFFAALSGNRPLRNHTFAAAATPVYTHFMRRIAALMLLCVFGALLPSATAVALAAPQQLLPICCRAHGAHACMMGSAANASSDVAHTLRQPGCPFGQSLRAVTTVTISADFGPRSSFGLAVTNIERQWIADAVASRVLRRSAPRGPPSSLFV